MPDPLLDDFFGDLLQETPPPVAVGPQWVTNRNWKELLIPSPKPIWEYLSTPMPDSMSVATAFDIETAPLTWDELVKIVPPFTDPPPFDPSSVKCGEFDKLKDREAAAKKAADKIAARRKEYEDEASGARQRYVDEVLSSATLSAMTCRVLTIGYGCIDRKSPQQHLVYVDGAVESVEPDERDLLLRFWSHLLWVRENHGTMIGAYIKTYDMPVIAQRSMVLGVKIPDDVLENDRYWSGRLFKCLNERWALGCFNSRTADVKAIDLKWQKLNALAKFFGCTPKTEDIGAEFWRVWQADRKRAIAYASGDIVTTLEVAQAMQVDLR